MPEAITVEVDRAEFNKLIRALDGIPPGMARGALRAGVTKVAAAIRKDARSRAPRVTGFSRKQIKSKPIKFRKNKRLRVGRHVGYTTAAYNPKGHSRQIDARFLEFGYGGRAAVPHLRPAMFANEKNGNRILAQAILNYLQRRVNKGRKP
ncbi:MAG: hypothetical protein GTO41_20005 [Burkholderiales bacterium]|nr:hypothetical protein [Burkholderiales bacterium]